LFTEEKKEEGKVEELAIQEDITPKLAIPEERKKKGDFTNPIAKALSNTKV